MINDLLRQRGWEVTTIGAVVELNPRRPRYEGLTDDTPVGFVSMAAVDEAEGIVSIHEERALGELRGKSYRTFAPGDVLFAKITPCMENGKAAVVPDLPSGHGFGSTEFHVLRPGNKVDGRYLWHFVRQEVYRREAARHMTGSVGQLRVPSEFIRETKIPLPPLPEQLQIVKLLDLVGQGRKAARARLVGVHSILTRLRRAVLAAACSGGLTKEWRAARGQVAESESASSEHLGRLLQIRMNSVKNQPLAPFITPDLPEIPEEWRWASADALTTLITKGTTPRATDMHRGDGEIPYLKVYNLTFDGAVDFTVDPTFIPRAVHDGPLKRSRVFPGDFLINIVGPPLGKVGVAPESHSEWNINQAIAILRPLTELNAEFLKLWLLSPSVQSHFAHRAKATAGQYNLTLRICRELPIPIPSPEEQAEIVRRVEELLQMIQDALEKVNTASLLLDQTSLAVLAKAFRGNLICEANINIEV